jgi:hypothetical protein
MARFPGAVVQSRLVRQETSPASVLRPPEPTDAPPRDAPPFDVFGSPPAPSPPVDDIVLPSGVFLVGKAFLPSSEPEHAYAVVPIPTRIRSTEYLMIRTEYIASHAATMGTVRGDGRSANRPGIGANPAATLAP